MYGNDADPYTGEARHGGIKLRELKSMITHQEERIRELLPESNEEESE
tara:strand:- start:2165 stop:2308 length:144 start_codon:yes stop_codon:yes gene_type:complete